MTRTSPPIGIDLRGDATGGRTLYKLQWPCRRTTTGWINSRKGTLLEVTPVKWRTAFDDCRDTASWPYLIAQNCRGTGLKWAAETASGIPGARIIGSKDGLNIPSPVSWFWPATIEWTVALPDPRVADRFYTTTLIYGEKQPVVFLVDADCQTRKLTVGPDEPESAEPARDLFGGPVVAVNGKTYRRLRTNPDAPAAWFVSFCNTDWSTEREAVTAAQRKGLP
jgi:hypothetical protein